MQAVTLVARQGDGSENELGRYNVPGDVDLSKGQRVKPQGRQLKNCPKGQAVVHYDRRKARVVVTSS